LHYLEAFDGDFVLAFRERRSPTLVDMMVAAIEVEVNGMASRKYKQDERKVKEEDHPPSFFLTLRSKMGYHDENHGEDDGEVFRR